MKFQLASDRGRGRRGHRPDAWQRRYARGRKRTSSRRRFRAGQFKTLAAALGAADLVDTLKGSGPFTVFAPTDEAFAKLPAGTVENLLKPENKDQLVAILTYHVVPGKVMAADVIKLKEAKTVNGKMLDIETKGDAVMVNDAKVTATDIGASNGVIHVIDTVILPPKS